MHINARLDLPASLISWEIIVYQFNSLKVHKIEIFFGFDFEICIISLLVM